MLVITSYSIHYTKLYDLRPVRTVSFALDYGAWRLDAFGYHLTSLLVHLAAVTGVFALALRWTGHLAGAALGAGLFALHP